MAPRKQYKALPMYSQTLSRCRDPFPCGHCGDSLLAKEYEGHCATRHALDPKLSCVWCGGRQTWPKGEKNLFVRHLLTCWSQFKLTLSPEPPSLSLTYVSPHRDAFGRSLDGLYLEPIYPMPADPCSMSFGDPYLDLAASYLDRYRRTRNECDWIHVMVRALAFPTFLQAMREDGGRSTTLPFWCWCEGGPYPEAQYRHHRHMIVVSSPPRHFMQDVWTRVRLSERPFRYFPCKKPIPIESEKHLINTLGYLCHRKSRCSFGYSSQRKREEKNLHFYLYYPRPTVYAHALALLYPGGCMELVNELFSHMDPSRLAEVPGLGRNSDEKGCLPVRAIPGIPLDLSVTVVAYTADQCLYVGPRKVPLPVGPKTTVPLFEAIGDEIWLPSPQQQMALNTSRAALGKLDGEIETLKGVIAKKEEVIAQQNETIVQQNETIHKLKRKLADPVEPSPKN